LYTLKKGDLVLARGGSPGWNCKNVLSMGGGKKSGGSAKKGLTGGSRAVKTRVGTGGEKHSL